MIDKKPLNFDWQYTPDFKEAYLDPEYNDEAFETVSLPHTNIEVPFNNFDESIYQFESCYRKKLVVDSLEEDEQLFINFDGVMTYAKVYLNGTFLKEHKGGYTPFRVDLTPALIPNEENVLVVYVDSRERNDIPPFGFVIDYLTYGGIYREVTLEKRNRVHAKHIQVTPMNVKGDNSDLEIKLHFDKKEAVIDIEYTILKDEDLIQTYHFENVPVDVITHQLHVENIKLWNLERPHLYHLIVQVSKNNKVIGTQKIRFGFRSFKFEEHGFYLNNEKIKIRGLNRHQSFPYVGYAMPKNAQRKDADILKHELGVNAVRLSHYPQSNHFLDRCDELGLLVFNEIPGWQHIGDEAWQEVAIENVSEMILKDHNHPSVFLWGTRINESQDNDAFYTKTFNKAKSLDTSRPTGGVRDFENSSFIEDIYTFNDFVHDGNAPGLRKKKDVIKSTKPYMVTEHNGHMYPTKKYDNESRRIEHAIRHMRVLNSLYEQDDISGAFGWCMFDYNTHKDFGSGDRICYHGVMDMFRIPKYAAHAYHAQSDLNPMMFVANAMNIGEFEGSLLDDIYIFTNCDYVKLYKNDKYINTFYPNKDKFKHLPHPLIIIDDLVGDEIKNNEQFSPKDAEIIKALLIKASKEGAHLPLLDQLKMLRLFIKYKMNMSHAEALYTKYFGGWGQKSTEYRFEGYMNDTLVDSKTHSEITKIRLDVDIDSKELIEDDTYDVTRVVMRLKDQNDHDVIYANESVRVEVSGPISLIGPKNIPLTGGSAAFWIRSKHSSGQGEIKVVSERFGTIIESVTVKKLNL